MDKQKGEPRSKVDPQGLTKETTADKPKPKAPELKDEHYKELFDNFDRAYQLMSPFWEQCLKLYQAYYPKPKKKKVDILELPPTKGLVGIVQKAGRIIAELNSMEHVIGVEPLFVGNVNVEEALVRADKLQELLNYLLNLGNFKTSVLPKFVLDATIFPSSFLKAGWQVEYAVDERGEYIPQAEYPVAKRISPLRAVFDMAAEDIPSSRFFHEITTISKETLKNYALKSNMDRQALDKVLEARADSGEFYRDQIKIDKKEFSDARYQDYVRLINSYYYFDAEGDGPGLYLVTWDPVTKEVLSAQKRVNKHGLIPVVAGTMMLNAETVTGLSPLMQAYYLLQEYAHFRNVAALNLNLAAALTLITTDQNDITVEGLRNRKIGTILKARSGPERPSQLRMDSMLNEILPFLNMQNEEIQSLLGFTNLTLGLETPPTARGAQILAAQAYTNQDISLQMLILSGLFPLYQIFLSDVQQFLSQEVWVRQHQNFISVRPEEIQGRYTATVGTLLTQAKAKSIADSLQTLMAMAGQAGLQLPYDQIMRLILKGYGIPRQIVEQLLPPPNQTPANAKKAKGIMGQNQPVGMPPMDAGAMPPLDMLAAMTGSSQPAAPMPAGMGSIPQPSPGGPIPPELLGLLAQSGIPPQVAGNMPPGMDIAAASSQGQVLNPELQGEVPAGLPPGLPPELANLPPDQLQAILALASNPLLRPKE